MNELSHIDVLYHASATPDIKVLKPFEHNDVDGTSVVFATPDIRFALAMAHGTSDDIAVGYFVNTKTYEEQMYIDELKRDAFHLMAAPAYLYEVATEGFYYDDRLTHVEVVCEQEVPVHSMTYYANIIEHLRMNHPEIMFVPYEQVPDAMKRRGKRPELPGKSLNTI